MNSGHPTELLVRRTVEERIAHVFHVPYWVFTSRPQPRWRDQPAWRLRALLWHWWIP